MMRRARVLLVLVLLPTSLGAATVEVTLGLDPDRLAGTDTSGRVLLYTPNPLEPGSSISHWDPSAFPNLLMEPSINSDLIFQRLDLTTFQLRDVGWPSGTSNVTIRVTDPPGQGFNDPNLGADRLRAVELAGEAWGNLLGSSVEINVEVSFDALDCEEGAGVLAQAGAQFIFDNFFGAPFTDTWYHGALAEAISGQNLSLEDTSNPNAGDLTLQFNNQIDGGCLGAGNRFYYGLNGNVPAGQISFVAVALHEMAHGLGFATFSNPATGALFRGQPDVYTRFVFDTTQGQAWSRMSNAERQASAINTGRVVWNGNRVTAEVDRFLDPAPSLIVHAPPSVAGTYRVGLAAFGPPLNLQGLSGELALARDATADPTLLCEAVANAAEVAGKVAVVDRGECNFTVKVKNAQDAGAIGVVLVNNVDGPPPNMGGADQSIVIPAVSVTIGDGELLKEALATVVVEPGVLRFSDATFRVSEGAGVVGVTVRRVGGKDGRVTVDVATADGTATAGIDYLPAAGTVVFADGEDGAKTFMVTVLDDGVEESNETIELELLNPTGGATLGTPSRATLEIVDDEACLPSATRLCLNQGRFRVDLDWRTAQGTTGLGQVVLESDDSGLLWFFDPDNWEMLVKVLDGCSINGRYWVFAAATTNVEYTLTVTDTQSGAVKAYANPLNVSSPAITDTNAFATCP